MEYIELNNGVRMPKLGFGVYKVVGDEVELAVNTALETGYRLIDTAAFYDNEAELGRVLRQSHVPREDLFLTTKVWNDAHGYDETLRAFEDSVSKLGVDYIDLYLIHWPCPQFNKYIETYRALEKLYKEKRVRAIGVCNFPESVLARLIEETTVPPVVNQVERHPYFQQGDLQQFCKQQSIQMEAWAPLMKGKIVDLPLIQELAKKYGKTPAQITIRWHLQTDWVAIPKSVTPSRIQENFEVFDFVIDAEDMERLQALDKNERGGRDPLDMHMV